MCHEQLGSVSALICRPYGLLNLGSKKKRIKNPAAMMARRLQISLTSQDVRAPNGNQSEGRRARGRSLWSLRKGNTAKLIHRWRRPASVSAETNPDQLHTHVRGRNVCACLCVCELLWSFLSSLGCVCVSERILCGMLNTIFDWLGEEKRSSI